MPRIAYEDKKFRPATLQVIRQSADILEEYARQGFDLTLRQLYYQFVARGLIPNRQSEYNKLGSIVNDARLSGYIDWEHIVDRTRNVRDQPHWDDPAAVIEATTQWFKNDLWADQPFRLEVWIEKDALIGVIEKTCRSLDVPFFSCRGYVSQSEMWSAAQRIQGYLEDGKQVRILHLGDHDPSGIDMTRDITDRLSNFVGQDHLMLNEGVFKGLSDANAQVTARQMYREVIARFDVDRLALNMDQVEQYEPPPNPAKVTDSRFESYLRVHGGESWELDALEPTVLAGLIQDAVERYMEPDLFEEAVEREREHIKKLRLTSRRWAEIEELLETDQGRNDES